MDQLVVSGRRESDCLGSSFFLYLFRSFSVPPIERTDSQMKVGFLRACTWKVIISIVLSAWIVNVPKLAHLPQR